DSQCLHRPEPALYDPLRNVAPRAGTVCIGRSINMTMDWCPGIREACRHWRDAPMLQQTFEALEHALDQNNDGCIDCRNTSIEVFCQVIIESFHKIGRASCRER